MSDEYKEEVVEEGDNVRVRRTYPKIPYGTATVEMYMTKAFLYGADEMAVRKYLDQTAAAILTRNGFEDAD
jgi:hypothetical protein